MNCSECLDRLEQLVDKELSPLEAAEVQIHMENCPPCSKEFRFEEGMKRLVHNCCGRERAPEQLRDRLREILEK